MADIDKRIPVRVSEAPGKASASGPPKRHMDELDHKFKDYLGRLGGAQVSLSGPRTPSKHRSIQPQERWRQYTDLFDSGSDYRVLIEVPGIPKEEIDISVSNTEARIELGKETAFYEENAGPVGRRETRSRILRSIRFPEEAMAEKAEATLNNGILEVRVPKRIPTGFSAHRIVTR